jgi:methionyl-tRNA synthetase
VTEAAPWTALAADPARAAVALRAGLGLLEASARVAFPFVPETASRVLQAFGVPDAEAPAWPGPGAAVVEGPPAGRRVGDPGPVFRRIGPEAIAGLRALRGSPGRRAWLTISGGQRDVGRRPRGL